MGNYLRNIWETITTMITGMRVTMRHMLHIRRDNVTLQYPEERWPRPERDIGFDHSNYNVIRSRLHVDIDDCIACMQCEKACPVDCIKIDTIKPPKDSEYDCGKTSHDTQKKMIVLQYEIEIQWPKNAYLLIKQLK